MQQHPTATCNILTASTDMQHPTATRNMSPAAASLLPRHHRHHRQRHWAMDVPQTHKRKCIHMCLSIDVWSACRDVGSSCHTFYNLCNTYSIPSLTRRATCRVHRSDQARSPSSSDRSSSAPVSMSTTRGMDGSVDRMSVWGFLVIVRECSYSSGLVTISSGSPQM